MTSPTAADTMRMVFARQVAPTLAAITPDHPAQRAGLMGAFIIGLATTRYVLANPAVADLDHDQLIALGRPRDPAPAGRRGATRCRLIRHR